MNNENEIIVQHIKSNLVEWKPLMEEGVDTKGIFIKVLRYDEKSKRAPSILLKFEPGAKYPAHNHPGGEEVFILEGEVRFGNKHLSAGDYLYTPPSGKHAVLSEKGCTMLLMIPEEVEIIKTK